MSNVVAAGAASLTLTLTLSTSTTTSRPLLSSSSSPSLGLGLARGWAATATTLFPCPRRHLISPSINISAKAATRREGRDARHQRIRKKVEGTPERPRMAVFRSNKHLYVQVIDDTKMHTLASASTMQKPVSEEIDCSSGPTIIPACIGGFKDPLLEVAEKVGEAIAKSCLEKGIIKVAFDRGGYPYHGRIEALASAAREHGLEF